VACAPFSDPCVDERLPANLANQFRSRIPVYISIAFTSALRNLGMIYSAVARLLGISCLPCFWVDTAIQLLRPWTRRRRQDHFHFMEPRLSGLLCAGRGPQTGPS